MRVLAMERELPGGTAEQFRPLLGAEAARVWQLYAEGSLREMYFSADAHEAVLVLECAGAREAEALLATLPLVSAGLIRFDVKPLVPYDGFARLFREGALVDG